MRVIVSLKGVKWSGHRLTITNTRLLIDRRQNLFIEIAQPGYHTRTHQCPTTSTEHFLPDDRL